MIVGVCILISFFFNYLGIIRDVLAALEIARTNTEKEEPKYCQKCNLDKYKKGEKYKKKLNDLDEELKKLGDKSTEQ